MENSLPLPSRQNCKLQLSPRLRKGPAVPKTAEAVLQTHDQALGTGALDIQASNGFNE
jgi:hypothetical protein